MKRIIVVQLYCLLILVFAGMSAQAQNTGRSISGTVTDANLPLDNVSVYEDDFTNDVVLTD